MERGKIHRWFEGKQREWALARGVEGIKTVEKKIEYKVINRTENRDICIPRKWERGGGADWEVGRSKNGMSKNRQYLKVE